MTENAPQRAPLTPASAARTAALIAAILIAGLLFFTAYAKAAYPNPKDIQVEHTSLTIAGTTFERTVAVIEATIAVVLIGLHRRWAVWILSTLFFGALAGYSFFKSWHGESCGCFSKMFDPPPYSMFAVDALIVALSLGLAAALRAPRMLLPVTMVGVLAAAGAGWVVSDAVTPPRKAETAQKHGNKFAYTRLFESEPLRDIREQPEGGPAWLVCAFDPTCHICEAMKPLIDFKREEFAESNDPILQIREFSIPELEKSLGIEQIAWDTPTVFVIQDGKITKLWSGKALEDFTPERFQEIYDTVSAGGYPPEDAPPMTAPAK
ncbi:MAG: hypothetical protein JNK58_07950 [Phycisphaerae bacterium]|nr:hypothetical protein [Phycisphaerae bacterium]